MSVAKLKKRFEEEEQEESIDEREVEHFISKAHETLAEKELNQLTALTIRIPKWMVAKIDTMRKERGIPITRNLLIMELLYKMLKDSR